MSKKSDPHEDHWRKLFDLYKEQQELTKEDFYKRRAESCQRLLDYYC